MNFTFEFCNYPWRSVQYTWGESKGALQSRIFRRMPPDLFVGGTFGSLYCKSPLQDPVSAPDTMIPLKQWAN